MAPSLGFLRRLLDASARWAVLTSMQAASVENTACTRLVVPTPVQAESCPTRNGSEPEPSCFGRDGIASLRKVLIPSRAEAVACSHPT